MTSLLHPAPVSSSRFTWDPPTRTYIADASDLPAFGRVWADSCDEGLTLMSTRRPGEQIVFTVDHVEHDPEGDLLYWDLVPALHGQPAARRVDFTIRIYND